jgi:hypothetical protein
MNAPSPLDKVSCARLPAGGLSLLAGLRARPDVRVRLEDGCAWVYWTAGDGAVLHRVLAVAGARLFEERGGRWYRPGHSLPSPEVPGAEGARPLAAVLVPAPVSAESCAVELTPLWLTLVRDDRPRPATALCCSLGELALWAESATSWQLAGLQAAFDPDGQVLLLGERLPPLAGGERCWGRSLLVPLGYRPEPDLGEDSLREALGLGGNIEVGLWTEEGLEVVPRSALGPMTRAGVRLAVGQDSNPAILDGRFGNLPHEG